MKSVHETASRQRADIKYQADYGPGWTYTLRQCIRQRDNFRCALCPSQGYTVHHIDHNKKNNDPANLIVVCRLCHDLIHSTAQPPARAGIWQQKLTKIQADRGSFPAKKRKTGPPVARPPRRSRDAILLTVRDLVNEYASGPIDDEALRNWADRIVTELIGFFCPDNDISRALIDLGTEELPSEFPGFRKFKRDHNDETFYWVGRSLLKIGPTPASAEAARPLANQLIQQAKEQREGKG